mmetsp:Transcript_28046/g.46607  ORF Transcript_28046/g.46607 Transcript_28046/m.46607 type:complete len:317 (-) Transcript_28046:174-1124(-)
MKSSSKKPRDCRKSMLDNKLTAPLLKSRGMNGMNSIRVFATGLEEILSTSTVCSMVQSSKLFSLSFEPLTSRISAPIAAKGSSGEIGLSAVTLRVPLGVFSRIVPGTCCSAPTAISTIFRSKASALDVSSLTVSLARGGGACPLIERRRYGLYNSIAPASGLSAPAQQYIPTMVAVKVPTSAPFANSMQTVALRVPLQGLSSCLSTVLKHRPSLPGCAFTTLMAPSTQTVLTATAFFASNRKARRRGRSARETSSCTSPALERDETSISSTAMSRMPPLILPSSMLPGFVVIARDFEKVTPSGPAGTSMYSTSTPH